MTETEQKALEWLNKARQEQGIPPLEGDGVDFDESAWDQAFRLALEAHEADKSRHAAELREQAERFSEAVNAYMADPTSVPGPATMRHLGGFILPAADPLAELAKRYGMNEAELREHFEERGLSIVAKED